MKTKIIFMATFALVFGSCINNLPEEQFDKYVLLTRNGWIEQDIAFTSSDVVDLPVAVSVSGTATNKENVSVTLEYDAELLARYNLEKYKAVESLYYTPVPKDVVSFSTHTVTLPSGAEHGVANLSIDFGQIADPYKDYVLPLRITQTSHYALQEKDKTELLAHSEALYHICRVNAFSGNYIGQSDVYRTIGTGRNHAQAYTLKTSLSGTIQTIDPGISVSSKTFYALSANECYFFAGDKDRNTIDRDDFIVRLRVVPAADGTDSLVFSSKHPRLQINANYDVICVDPVKSPKVYAEPTTLETVYMPVPADQRYETVRKTFKFTYTYYNLSDRTDSTSTNNHILCTKGMFTRERNELIK